MFDDSVRGKIGASLSKKKKKSLKVSKKKLVPYKIAWEIHF